jgi:carbon dioxide concentrating mechanism protein CcmO
MQQALGILEVQSWSVGMVAIDAATKAASVRVLQAELNDLLGICARFAGDVAALRVALDAAQATAQRCGVSVVVDLIPRPAPNSESAWLAKPESNPLIEQDVVHFPREENMAESNQLAIGFIETQGFTAVIEAVDSACKAANVEVVGREKLGGGYIAVVVRGDVAAVRAAVDAAKPRVEGLGKLIATHVIARPSQAVLSLLPKA